MAELEGGITRPVGIVRCRPVRPAVTDKPVDINAYTLTDCPSSCSLMLWIRWLSQEREVSERWRERLPDYIRRHARGMLSDYEVWRKDGVTWPVKIFFTNDSRENFESCGMVTLSQRKRDTKVLNEKICFAIAPLSIFRNALLTTWTNAPKCKISAINATCVPLSLVSY